MNHLNHLRLQNSRFFLKTSLRRTAAFFGSCFTRRNKSGKKQAQRSVRVLVSLSVFSLAPDLLFDCLRLLEYAKIRTVLQSRITLNNTINSIPSTLQKLFIEMVTFQEFTHELNNQNCLFLPHRNVPALRGFQINGQSERFRQRTSTQCHTKAMTTTHRFTTLLMLYSHTKKRLKHAREADNSSWRKLVIKYGQRRTKPTTMANLKSCIPMLSFLQEQVSK